MTEHNDISITTDGVRGAAKDVDALSRDVQKRLRQALDGSYDVFAAHSVWGWRSADSLNSCATTWEDHLISLAKTMGTLGQKMHYAADGYDATDKEAEQRFRAGLTDLGKA